MNRRSALGLLAAAPVALAREPGGVFTPAVPPAGSFVAEPEALGRVAADLLRWFAANPTDAAQPTEPVLATLRWIVAVVAEDARSLEDADFLARHLHFESWTPDRQGAAARGIALGADEIRLTKYLAWRQEGRRARVPGFETALYAVPADEAGLDPEELAARTDLLRLRFSRAEVLDGAYEVGGAAEGQARALAWLPRTQVHEALLQGTVVVDFPDGEVTLNVHRNNGRTWKPEFARLPEKQERLWYFKEVSGLLGYGGEDKVRLEPRVVVAGDVEALGLGGLYVLSWGEGAGARSRLVLLADTGGAFHPNLFQLDWLVGTFATRADFDKAASVMPDRVRAFSLTVRDPG